MVVVDVVVDVVAFDLNPVAIAVVVVVYMLFTKSILDFWFDVRAFQLHSGKVYSCWVDSVY